MQVMLIRCCCEAERKKKEDIEWCDRCFKAMYPEVNHWKPQLLDEAEKGSMWQLRKGTWVELDLDRETQKSNCAAIYNHTKST